MKHYFGEVTYDVSNFVEKGSDVVTRDVSIMMFDARNSLLKILFPEGARSLRRFVTFATFMFDICDFKFRLCRGIEPQETSELVEQTDSNSVSRYFT